MSGNSQVRTTAVLCFLCVIALTVAFPVQAQAQPQAETPDAVVSPGESIQDAIETASPGETIQLNSGTYEQGIVIDKNLNIVASGDVTLNGAGVSAEDGIVVETTNVTIDGIEIAQFSDNGIDVRGNNLDPRQIEIVNVTSRLNGGNNILIASSPAEDTVELTNVVSRNNDFGDGISIGAETVTIDTTTSTGSEATGLDISAGETGTVSIEQSVFSSNGDEDFDEEGVRITTAQEITITGVTTLNNDDEGISILGSDAITGGRTINLTNVTSRGNLEENIAITGTSDVDTVELTNVVSRNSARGVGDVNGILIDAETVTIDNTTSTGSGGAGLDISAGETGTVSIEQSVFSSNGDEDFDEEGVRITTAQEITITGVTTLNNDDEGISILGSDAITGGRTINLTNVTSRGNLEENIAITGTSDVDTVELTNVVSRNSARGVGDVNGILIDAETVTIDNTTSTGSGGAGLDISAGETGTVSIEQSVFSSNGDEDFDEEGVRITTAQEITITGVTTLNNDDNGISILGSEAITGGRTINLTDVTSRGNLENGAFIGGTADGDAVSIANSRFDQNDDDGLETQVESVNIAQTNLTRNTLAGARFAGAFTGGTLTQSSIFKNGGPAIVNEVSGTTVDATNNWWGNPSGPGTNEIAGSGNVDATDPLPAPPDPDTDTDTGSGSGSGSTAITAQRTLNATEVTNGSTVTVTVSATFESSIDDAKVVDNINGQGISADNLTITDADGGFRAVTENPAVDVSYADELNVGLGSESLTVEYELTIPEDTPVGTTITFDGNVTNAETDETARIDGDSSVEVVATTSPDTVTVGNQEIPAEFTSETASGDPTVTADNAVEAIDTFIAGDVSADVAVDVIDAFIAS